ncbi:MAG: DUF488 domain-containing protein [Acidobacteriaceae bacterium]|nr:DUF488 domain-containing protein [Acidobacteriaceae bacterium]
MTTIYTIGHSTRGAEDFVRILNAFGIRQLADIRTVPRSARNPQYDQDALKQFLRNHDIAYVHLKALGGLRRPRKHSPNTGWKNDSFRGYADYMQTNEFRRALAELVAIAGEKTTAIMCAEAVPWRCHRSLVGDALLVRGIEVEDIMSETSAKPHTLTPWARADGVRLTYPAETPAHPLESTHTEITSHAAPRRTRKTREPRRQPASG